MVTGGTRAFRSAIILGCVAFAALLASSVNEAFAANSRIKQVTASPKRVAFNPAKPPARYSGPSVAKQVGKFKSEKAWTLNLRAKDPTPSGFGAPASIRSKMLSPANLKPEHKKLAPASKDALDWWLKMESIDGEYKPEILIKFQDKTTSQQRDALISKYELTKLSQVMYRDDFLAVRVPGGVGAVLGVLQRIARSDREVVENAEPNWIMHAAVWGDSEPYYGWEHYYGTPNFGAAWTPSYGYGAYGDSTESVAVLDSGIDPYHPDLQAGWFSGSALKGMYNLVDNTGWSWDYTGHGTHVAGTMMARLNGQGTAGLAWNARFVALKVLGNDGTTTDLRTTLDAIPHVDYTRSRVVNMSYGTNPGTGYPRYTGELTQAIAARPNTEFVAAAGNDSRDLQGDTKVLPCSIQAVICVASTTTASPPTERISSFSNYDSQQGADWGTPGVDVDIAARGESILAPTPGNWHTFLSGTSMAAPQVSGAYLQLITRTPSIPKWQLDGLMGLCAGGGPRSNLWQRVPGQKFLGDINCLWYWKNRNGW